MTELSKKAQEGIDWGMEIIERNKREGKKAEHAFKELGIEKDFRTMMQLMSYLTDIKRYDLLEYISK